MIYIQHLFIIFIRYDKHLLTSMSNTILNKTENHTKTHNTCQRICGVCHFGMYIWLNFLFTVININFIFFAKIWQAWVGRMPFIYSKEIIIYLLFLNKYERMRGRNKNLIWLWIYWMSIDLFLSISWWLCSSYFFSLSLFLLVLPFWLFLGIVDSVRNKDINIRHCCDDGSHFITDNFSFVLDILFILFFADNFMVF